MKWSFQRSAERASPAFWISKPYLGIVRRPDGILEISLTKEESDCVQRHLDVMNAIAKEESGGSEVLVHPEAAKVLEAQGLWLHAHGVFLQAEFAGRTVLPELEGQIAIAALTKAYSLCCFPVVLADIAKAFRMSGDQRMEARLNREFSEVTKQFQRTQLYDTFLEWRKGVLGPS